MVWRKAHDLVLAVYPFTGSFPQREMRRAERSPEESRYYHVLAQDLGYGNTEQQMRLLEEVSRLVERLRAQRSGF